MHFSQQGQGNLPIEKVTNIIKHRHIPLQKGKSNKQKKLLIQVIIIIIIIIIFVHICLVTLNSPVWVPLGLPFPTSVPTMASSGKLGESKAVKELASSLGWVGWLVVWLRFSLVVSKEKLENTKLVSFFWVGYSTPQPLFQRYENQPFHFFWVGQERAWNAEPFSLFAARNFWDVLRMEHNNPRDRSKQMFACRCFKW